MNPGRRNKIKAQFIDPMLLLRQEKLPEGADWLYEILRDLLQKIADLLEDLRVLDFDHACAERFGKVRAVALVHDFTLVTNNTAVMNCRKHPTPDQRLRQSGAISL